MKKILFIVPTLSNGGAENVVARISSRLVHKGYDVSVLIFYNCEDEYSIDSKVKIINLSKGKYKEYKKISRINRFYKIRKIVKLLDPNEIIPFLDYICLYTFISLVFTKYIKRLNFTERNNPKYANKKIYLVKKILQIFIKKIILQNKGQQSLLTKREKKKSFIIPNPIDDKYFDYQKEMNIRPLHIISIGRLSEQKDYSLAINAFSKIVKNHPNLTYHIFGKGEDKEKIENQIKEMNLKEKVILEGFTTDIDLIYKNADIFLMTSLYEGMPNALAESLAVGIPSISMDCDFGPRDLIENEQMGILIKDHTVDATVNALSDMIENYNYFSLKAEQRKNIIKSKYSLEKITDEWIKFIENQ